MPQREAGAIPRVSIGIWAEHGEGSRWTNEGMARLVGFLIEGAAESGRVTFRLVLPMAMRDEALADLRSLRASEGVDWTLDCPEPEPEVPPVLPLLPDPINPTVGRPSLRRRLYWRLRPGARAAARQARAQAAARRAAAVRELLLAEKLQGPDREAVAAALPDNSVHAVLDRVVQEAAAAAMAAANATDADALAQAEARAVSHAEDAERVASSLRGWDRPRRHLRALAAFANAQVKVDAWVLLFPHFVQGLALQGRKVVICPDTIGATDFIDVSPGNWKPEGWMMTWRRATAQTLAKTDGTVTFSHHIARSLAGPPFAVPAERITVVTHPPPDLRPSLPFLNDRRGDAGTRRQAADLLRAEAARREQTYLRDFPFEEVPYCVVSTQDRQTKNIGLVADALHCLVRQQRFSCKVITTAPLRGNAAWQRLPGFIAANGLGRDFVSLPDLERAEHAALYHCATIAVHASFIEGGDTVFPFHEAVSLGTPCLMADGPHIQEFLRRAPELTPFVFNPHDAEALAALIRRTMTGREAALDVQLSTYERLRQRRWADAALEYATAAIGRAP